MKSIIGILVVLFIYGAVFTHEANAQVQSPQNGVEVIPLRGSMGITAKPFTAFDPSAFGTVTVYNDAGETSTIAGSVVVANMHGKHTVHIAIPTMNSTSIRIDCWGQGANRTTWFPLYGFIYTAAVEGDNWPISDYINRVRFSTTVIGPVAGDIVTVSADFNEGAR